MKKSVNQNFKDMGLAFNLSKTFPIPKTKVSYSVQLDIFTKMFAETS